MLMIRENDLETVLANRRNFIGIAPRLESALTIITGVFYVASAVVMEDLWWKIPMYVLGAIVTIYGIAGVIRKPYTTKQLFKEIAGMNAIASSIIAITEPGISDSNKYLVYWDTKWKCWFFPNRRSTRVFRMTSGPSQLSSCRIQGSARRLHAGIQDGRREHQVFDGT